ncbi:hypothetical protein FA15DRAFT_672268 [Coprinopsis marcescibilis]|uniref:Secreted protein n=1 Tax=Coprinopsis marcescibilis TaxID=230819 RepID=A0A5C3KNR8_COPMA|nr:hypothetical protein FA15DRAFT_672268 [Coprinopsis marcescibilis]
MRFSLVSSLLFSVLVIQPSYAANWTYPMMLRLDPCMQSFFPNWVYQAFNCPVQAKVTIPAILKEPPLHAVAVPITTKLPDPKAMTTNRLEIGKIMGILAGIDTPQSKQTLEAVQQYDNMARKTIRSISKLQSASEMAADTIMGIIKGVAECLQPFPSNERRPAVVGHMRMLRQKQVDSWIEGLQDILRSLYLHAQEAEKNLDACDSALQQIQLRSGKAKIEQESSTAAAATLNAKQDKTEYVNWMINSDGDPQRPLASAVDAIAKFHDLLEMVTDAKFIVANYSHQLAMVMLAIEAAYRYPDLERLLVVDMMWPENVEITERMLRRIQREIEMRKTDLLLTD